MEEIRQGKSRPLKNITSGEHFHTVSADSAQTLDLIEEELRKKDYLVRTVEIGKSLIFTKTVIRKILNFFKKVLTFLLG